MKKKLFIPDTLIEVRTAKGNKFINSSDIIYIQGNNKYSIIYLCNKEEVEANHLLKWYEEKSDPSIFLRCHASYIVNSGHIDCICSDRFLLKGDIFIPISRTRKKQVIQDYKLFIHRQEVNLLPKCVVCSKIRKVDL